MYTYYINTFDLVLIILIISILFHHYIIINEKYYMTSSENSQNTRLELMRNLTNFTI